MHPQGNVWSYYNGRESNARQSEGDAIERFHWSVSSQH
jgi:hypothetical protein